MTWLVALAGGGGAVVRYLFDDWISRSRETQLSLIQMPWGTFTINVTGSLVLGVLAGLVIAHGLDPDVQLVAGTGFLGGYTTFSAYAYESLRLIEEGSPRMALGYAVASVTAGLVAATLGLLVSGAL